MVWFIFCISVFENKPWIRSMWYQIQFQFRSICVYLSLSHVDNFFKLWFSFKSSKESKMFVLKFLWSLFGKLRNVLVFLSKICWLLLISKCSPQVAYKHVFLSSSLQAFRIELLLFIYNCSSYNVPKPLFLFVYQFLSDHFFYPKNYRVYFFHVYMFIQYTSSILPEVLVQGV